MTTNNLIKETTTAQDLVSLFHAKDFEYHKDKVDFFAQYAKTHTKKLFNLFLKEGDLKALEIIDLIKESPEFQATLTDWITHSPLRNCELLHFISILFFDNKKYAPKHLYAQINIEPEYLFLGKLTPFTFLTQETIFLKLLSIFNEEIEVIVKVNEEIKSRVHLSNITNLALNLWRITSLEDGLFFQRIKQKEQLLTLMQFAAILKSFHKDHFRPNDGEVISQSISAFSIANKFYLPLLARFAQSDKKIKSYYEKFTFELFFDPFLQEESTLFLHKISLFNWNWNVPKDTISKAFHLAFEQFKQELWQTKNLNEIVSILYIIQSCLKTFYEKCDKTQPSILNQVLEEFRSFVILSLKEISVFMETSPLVKNSQSLKKLTSFVSEITQYLKDNG